MSDLFYLVIRDYKGTGFDQIAQKRRRKKTLGNQQNPRKSGNRLFCTKSKTLLIYVDGQTPYFFIGILNMMVKHLICS